MHILSWDGSLKSLMSVLGCTGFEFMVYAGVLKRGYSFLSLGFSCSRSEFPDVMDFPLVDFGPLNFGSRVFPCVGEENYYSVALGFISLSFCQWRIKSFFWNRIVVDRCRCIVHTRVL